MQCQRCLAWRRVPVQYGPNESFVCADNEWDPDFAKCLVAEESDARARPASARTQAASRPHWPCSPLCWQPGESGDRLGCFEGMGCETGMGMNSHAHRDVIRELIHFLNTEDARNQQRRELGEKVTIRGHPEYRGAVVKAWYTHSAHIRYFLRDDDTKRYADFDIADVQLPRWKPKPEQWRQWATRYGGCFQAADPVKQLRFEMRRIRREFRIRGTKFEDEE